MYFIVARATQRPIVIPKVPLIGLFPRHCTTVLSCLRDLDNGIGPLVRAKAKMIVADRYIDWTETDGVTTEVFHILPTP